ncbi:MAG: hypothetical protein ACOX3G_12770 [Armatimonadota bacterium]|jgi:hypothetical protein
MSICPHCDQSLPEEVPGAVFCVWCGKRVAQICPYQESEPDAVVPIADANGHWQASCPLCGHPFKACPICGRLYKLDERNCLNPGCSASLIEPSSAFPSDRGSLDGTNSARWSGVFGHSIRPVAALTCKEDIRLIAYRYGQLVAVSPKTLLSFRWDGQNWHRVSTVLLPQVPGFEPRSLILDDGHAFVLGDRRAIAISLMDDAVYKDYEGIFVRQAKDEKHWLVIRSIAGLRTEILAVDTTAWTESVFSLDLRAQEITDAVAANGLHLATEGRGVLSLSLDSGEARFAQELSGCRCTRIASSSGRLISVGYDSEQQLRIWSFGGPDDNHASRLLGQDAIAEFSVLEENLYVACRAGVLRFELGAITRNPERVDLSTGASTEPDMLAITDGSGDSRLLLKRSSPGRTETCLINPSTGAVSSVATTAMAPILCVADSRLVVASREGAEVKLRTYAFQEAS